MENKVRKVSDLIRLHVSEKRIIEILRTTSDKTAREILSEFEKLKQGNNENNIFENLYFPTLSTVLKHVISDLPEQCQGIRAYRKKFHANNVYGKLRNAVAHPVKPLFTSRDSISDVDELITDYYIISDLLD